MSLENNKELVAGFFAALSKNNGPAIFAALSPEISWWIQPSTKLGGQYDGMDAVMKMFMKNARLFDLGKPMTWEIQRMIAEGDFVAVQATMRGTTSKGVEYFNFFHFQIEVKDNKICTLREYNDSHHSHLVLFGDG